MARRAIISPKADGAFALSYGRGRRTCVSRSEKYRRFAQACLEIARRAEDQQARASLLHMAQVWLRLAEERVNEAADEMLSD
jgi:hypothetical protein